MRSLSLSAVLLVFVGCQFQASCGGKKLNMEKAVEFVGSTLEKDVGQKPSAVTCPDSVKIAAGTMFECTVAFGAPKATVVISQDDDKGNVTIKSITGILIAAKLEKAISDDFGSKLNVHITTTCGDRVRTATAGDKFTCDARDAKGDGGKVMVTVKDTSGNVSFELVRPEAPTEPAPAPTEPAPTP